MTEADRRKLAQLRGEARREFQAKLARDVFVDALGDRIGPAPGSFSWLDLSTREQEAWREVVRQVIDG